LFNRFSNSSGRFLAALRNVLSVPFVFPDDIIDRLKEDKITWKNYQLFSDAFSHYYERKGIKD